MDYSKFTIEDFVTDESFIQWVRKPTEEGDAFWNAFLYRHPDKRDVVKEARQIVQLMQIKEIKPPEGKFIEIWGNILKADEAKVVDFGDVRIHQHGTRKLSRSLWYKAAAACLLLFIGAWAYLTLSKSEMVTIQTAYGESRTLFLPDSSKVTLNSNSKLHYSANFNGANREVWLDGEAFFAITHKPDNENFLVHTDELQIEVLGTRFNVNSRRGRSQVVLEEGKVKLDIQSGEEKAGLIMQPGEMVEFSAKTKSLDKRSVEVSNYSSWRNNRFTFVGTSLEEIAHLLEDNYGYEVSFENKTTKSYQFTGSTSVDDPQELLQKLTIVFDLNIQKEGSKLIIK